MTDKGELERAFQRAMIRERVAFLRSLLGGRLKAPEEIAEIKRELSDLEVMKTEVG